VAETLERRDEMSAVTLQGPTTLVCGLIPSKEQLTLPLEMLKISRGRERRS
jgi:hypothetical protein